MKPIAFYLPQYHVVEENNKWWGEGFTEWNTVKSAQKYNYNQYQPKVPLNNNYYDLSSENGETLEWQAKLAKQYGVYGFCFYHYWFENNKKMLYKPAEILLNNKQIDLNYCFCWANEPWRRTWYAGNYEILIDQKYGCEEDWKIHYEYLRQFFYDSRYIKKENKPVLLIYKTSSIACLKEMLETWRALALKDGFAGLYIISERTAFKNDVRSSLFNAYADFEPAFSLHYKQGNLFTIKRVLGRMSIRVKNKLFNKREIENMINIKRLYKSMGRDKKYKNKPVYAGICPMWDNTPRKGNRGVLLTQSSPEIFKEKLMQINQERKEDEYVFINAWNEWSEGAYLEPDTLNKYAYLEAIRDSKINKKG